MTLVFIKLLRQDRYARERSLEELAGFSPRRDVYATVEEPAVQIEAIADPSWHRTAKDLDRRGKPTERATCRFVGVYILS